MQERNIVEQSISTGHSIGVSGGGGRQPLRVAPRGDLGEEGGVT